MRGGEAGEQPACGDTAVCLALGDERVDDVPRVVERDDPVAVHGDDTETVCFFTAEAEGDQPNGVLRVIAVHGAPAREITLMIRPLEALRAGVKAMERQLRTPARAG